MIRATDTIRLAVIVGSNREGRFAPVVANWFVDRVRQRPDIELDVIDLADIDLPSRYGDRPESMGEFCLRVGSADAFVVITPEYNHSYPAGLKQAIDHSGEEWRAKPVGFVGYGGRSGALRAIEHLRLVFAELHAVTIRDVVSLHNVWSMFDGDGTMGDAESCNAAVKVMLDELVWFAAALRTARHQRPYRA